jgi:hypothetical protein
MAFVKTHCHWQKSTVMATPRENWKKQARSEANMPITSDQPNEVAIVYRYIQNTDTDT